MSDKHTDAQSELREAFEAWCLAERNDLSSIIDDFGNKHYCSTFTGTAWRVWQAAKIRATEGQAQTSAARWQECLDVSFCECDGDRQFVGVMFPRPAGDYASTSAEFAAAVDISRASQLADSTAPGAKCVECEGAGSINDSTGLCTVCQSIAGTTAPGAPVDTAGAPVTYLRWWARQIDEGHGNIGHDEGYEECKPDELSDDGSPAFPVYAAPTAQQSLTAGGAVLAEMEARKDAAYLERNQVVAALAKAYPSGVARTAIEGWSEDWHGCVYIDLPTGQASWHFHDSQAYLFDGLPPYAGKWDGHDTDEKYRRLSQLAAAPLPQVQSEALDANDICQLPPTDWYCTRKAGHVGPCAAHQHEPDRELDSDDHAAIAKGVARIRAHQQPVTPSGA